MSKMIVLREQISQKKKSWNLYQHSLEQPALSDVKTAILGQNFDVLDSIVEPVEDESDMGG